MNVCPACGQPNDDKARYCSECRTRLENYGRARYDEKEPEFVPMPDTALRPKPAGLSLATVSLVLGIFGIGLPALVFGVFALRKEPAHRKKALAGTILGAVGTLALVIVLVAALNRGDPLRRRITVEGVDNFSLLALDRVDDIQSQALKLQDRLGPGGADDLSPVYALLARVRTRVDNLDSISDEESLNVEREGIVSQLDSARLELGNR
jgi:hypothetical protein